MLLQAMCCWLCLLHHHLPLPALASAAQAVAELEKQGYNPEVRGSIAHALMAMFQCGRLHTSTTLHCTAVSPALLAMLSFVPQVIDLISLKPFDMETITKSIKKTRKVGQLAAVFAAAWPGPLLLQATQQHSERLSLLLRLLAAQCPHN